MLAEVLYRIKKVSLMTAAVCTAMLCTGCEWDGVEIPEPEFDHVEMQADDPANEPEALAKTMLEEWFGLLSKGEKDTAKTYTADRVGKFGADIRLFDTIYPGEAEISYYAPAKSDMCGAGYLVTLKTLLIPKDLPETRLYSDFVISVSSKGETRIELITEVGAPEAMDGMLYRKAYQAYNLASDYYEQASEKPWGGIHHSYEGSEMTNMIEDRMKPLYREYYEVAIRNGRVMYVSWSDGSMTQRYPHAPETDELLELGPP